MHLLVIITAPDDGTAERIAGALLDEKLIACASRFPVSSVYRWKGKVENAAEVMLLCKTREKLVEDLTRRVKELHPYEVPEIITIPITGGSSEYLDWIDESTG
ncbi:MAG: divalent-cation tolerance protein CutA [Candidatus Dadabacteria bacterium]|nr:divalent-cation tolerance protein CutA [Candidatus Dadabacteria bacterium]